MHSESRKQILPRSKTGLNSTVIALAAPEPPCRVLIVDDDPLILSRVTGLLVSRGYEVHSTHSADEALRMVDAKACQIVITDWQMPGMDGIAFCRNLRLLQRDGYVYVLMLTVREAAEDILAGLAAGADDYVGKLASSEELLARVEVGRRIARLDQSLRASRQEIERISITDPVTGACNRNFLMKFLPRELRRSQRYTHPLAVIACDVDDFEGLADRFGQAAADEVLRSVARRTGKCIRQGIDWFARLAGGQFILVLPETNLTGAMCLSQRLRQTLSGFPVSTSAGPIAITASVGVTALDTSDDLASASTAGLLRAAEGQRQHYASSQGPRDIH